MACAQLHAANLPQSPVIDIVPHIIFLVIKVAYSLFSFSFANRTAMSMHRAARSSNNRIRRANEQLKHISYRPAGLPTDAPGHESLLSSMAPKGLVFRALNVKAGHKHDHAADIDDL